MSAKKRRRRRRRRLRLNPAGAKRLLLPLVVGAIVGKLVQQHVGNKAASGAPYMLGDKPLNSMHAGVAVAVVGAGATFFAVK